MDDTIIVALIAFLGTCFGSYMTQNKTTAVIEEKILNLTRKVEEHNNLVKRTYELEKKVATIETRIEEIK